MKKYLLNIKIGDKKLLPILIYDENEPCKASSMKNFLTSSLFCAII